MRRILILGFVLAFAAVPVWSAGEVNEEAPFRDTRGPEAFGDELFQIDFTTPTTSILGLGVDYFAPRGTFFVTAAGLASTAEQNYLFELATDGTVLNTYVQPTTSTWGWRDLADDGVYLYASDSAVVEQIDPATGAATGVTNPCRALAYNPVSDTFFAQNFGSSLWEFDRSGTVLNTFGGTTGLGAYGAAWQDAAQGGAPSLWIWSQDGIGVLATEVDPTTGNPTGVTFDGSVVTGANIAGGADIYVDGSTVVFAGMHQSDLDTIVGYELAIVVPATPLIEIPTLTPVGVGILALLLAGLSIGILRRRSA